MSAKPESDEKHVLQFNIDGYRWRKALKAARGNGVKTVAALGGMLFHREFERLGITDDNVDELLAGLLEDDEEHRVQIPVDELVWKKVQVAAARNGLDRYGTLGRVLMQKEFDRLGIKDEDVAEQAPKRKKKKKRAKA